MSDSSRPHGLQPTRVFHPWDFPGKSTGVGCHFLIRFQSTRLAIYNHVPISLLTCFAICKMVIRIAAIMIYWFICFFKKNVPGTVISVIDSGSTQSSIYTVGNNTFNSK